MTANFSNNENLPGPNPRIFGEPRTVLGQLPAVPRWERWAVSLVLAVFVAVAIHEIGNFANEGQDFYSHRELTLQMRDHPEIWYVKNSSTRPLLYMIGAACVRWLGVYHGIQLVSFIFTLAGAAALGLLHDASRRIIRSPLMRVTGIAFLAYLPLTIITTVVYAADTLVSLPFVMAGWCLVVSLETESDRKALFTAILGCLATCVGAFSKATFMAVPIAVVFILLAMWRAGRLARRRGLMLFAVGAVVPSLFSGFVAHQAERQFAGELPSHLFIWNGTDQLTISNLLFIKPSDRQIFDAPGYYDKGYPLLISNRFSYPARLHLAIFTDVLDYAQNAHRLIPRPDPQWSASRWSVQIGVIFSVGAFVAVVFFWVKTLAAIVRPASMSSAAALTWATLAMAWFVPIAGALPFIYHVNIQGYWLPRFVVPALWIFFLSLFASVDHLPDRWRKLCSPLLAAAVLLLSAIEIRSIWY